MMKCFQYLFILSLSALVLFTFVGCKKQKTLHVDLTVRDFNTGEAIKANVSLEYTNQVGQGNTTILMPLGETDNDGKLEIKKYLGKKYNLRLIVYGGVNYTHCMATYSYGVETRTGRKQKVVAELHRQYRYLLSLKNINCFDQTDTVWVTLNETFFSPTYRLVGCVDTTVFLGGSSTLSWSSLSLQPIFHIIVKRNGVTSESNYQGLLQNNVITPIQIDY